MPLVMIVCFWKCSVVTFPVIGGITLNNSAIHETNHIFDNRGSQEIMPARFTCAYLNACFIACLPSKLIVDGEKTSRVYTGCHKNLCAFFIVKLVHSILPQYLAQSHQPVAYGGSVGLTLLKLENHSAIKSLPLSLLKYPANFQKPGFVSFQFTAQ